MGKVSVVVKKAKLMFYGNLCDEAIDSTSNGDVLTTTAEVEIGSVFIAKN